MYGRQKREGELAVLKEREQGAKTTVLRVPLLSVLTIPCHLSHVCSVD